MGPIQKTVGIELVDGQLRVAVLQSRFGKLTLVQSAEIADFEQLSIEDKRNSLSVLVKEHGLQHLRAFLTLPRQMGLIRQSELPVEIGDRLRNAIALQIESFSPWAADEIYWDCAANVPAKETKARTLTVTTAIIPRSVLDPWIVLFKSAGLPLSGVALSSLAHAHAAGVLWPPASSDVLLSCEPSRLDGVVVRDGTIAAFSSEESGTSQWSVDSKGALARALALCRINPAEDGRVVVFGRSAAELEQTQAVTMPVEKAERATASIFGPVSAALLGLRRSAFNLNLVPAADRFRRNPLQLVPTYVILFMVLALGLAAVFRVPYQRRQYVASLDAEIAKLNPAVQEVLAQETELSAVNERYRALRSLVDNRDLNLEALRELARILPQDCFLAGYVAQGQTVTITGFAQSASAIQKLLEDNPLFSEVQFSSAVSRDPSGKERFSIKATLVGMPL